MFTRLSLLLLAVGFSSLNADLRAEAAGFGGEYCAIVNGDSFASSGRFRLVLTNTGLGSVSVLLGNERPCVGRVSLDPLDGTVGNRGDRGSMQIHLVLNPNPDGGYLVTGTIEEDGKTFTVTAPQMVKDPGSALGAHTIVVGSSTSVVAVGIGVAKVTRNGHVAGVFFAGSQRPVSFGGTLTPDHEYPLLLRFPRAQLSYVAEVAFTAAPTSGTVAQHYQDTSRIFYSKRANHHPQRRPVVDSPGDYRLAFELGGSSDGAATQLNNGRIVQASIATAHASIRVNPATGLVTGGSPYLHLHGVALQDDGILIGLLDGYSTDFRIYSLGRVSSTGPGSSDGSGVSGGSLDLGTTPHWYPWAFPGFPAGVIPTPADLLVAGWTEMEPGKFVSPDGVTTVIFGDSGFSIQRQ